MFLLTLFLLFWLLSPPTLAALVWPADCAGLNALTITQQASNFSASFHYNLPNERFADVTPPSGIIYPRDIAQVQVALRCIKARGEAIRIRSGGHSYEGLSSSAPSPFIIVDLKYLNSVSVNVQSKTATAGGGTLLGELYHKIIITSSTLAFAGGTCPTVGLAGLVSGGGYGLLGRKYGLAIDNVLSMKMVAANGTLINCSAQENPDLFWALRGGGGGTFGVVVEYTLNLVSVPSKVTYGDAGVSLSQAESFWNQYQNWITSKNIPKEMMTTIYIDKYGISMGVQYLGSRSSAIALLKGSPIENLITASNMREGPWSDSVLYNTFSDPPLTLSDLPSRYNTARPSFYAGSDFVKNTLPTAAIALIVKALNLGFTGGNPYVLFDGYYYGQATLPSKTDTPFQNRDVYHSIQYQAVYGESSSASAANEWLKALQKAMEPYVTGGAYVNYLSLNYGVEVPVLKTLTTVPPPPPNWARRYFGEENWNRLVKIKANVDFENYFNLPQSIPVVVLPEKNSLPMTASSITLTTKASFTTNPATLNPTRTITTVRASPTSTCPAPIVVQNFNSASQVNTNLLGGWSDTDGTGSLTIRSGTLQWTPKPDGYWYSELMSGSSTCINLQAFGPNAAISIRLGKNTSASTAVEVGINIGCSNPQYRAITTLTLQAGTQLSTYVVKFGNVLTGEDLKTVNAIGLGFRGASTVVFTVDDVQVRCA